MKRLAIAAVVLLTVAVMVSTSDDNTDPPTPVKASQPGSDLTAMAQRVRAAVPPIPDGIPAPMPDPVPNAPDPVAESSDPAATPDPATVDQISKRIDELSQRVADLESRPACSCNDKPNPPATPPKSATSAATRLIVLHTFANGNPCSFCDRWKAVEMPKLLTPEMQRAGVRVEMVADVAHGITAPRFSVTVGDSTKHLSGYQPANILLETK